MSKAQSCEAGSFLLFSIIILSRFSWITVNCFSVVPILMVSFFGGGFIGSLGIAMFLINSFGNFKRQK